MIRYLQDIFFLAKFTFFTENCTRQAFSSQILRRWNIISMSQAPKFVHRQGYIKQLEKMLARNSEHSKYFIRAWCPHFLEGLRLHYLHLKLSVHQLQYQTLANLRELLMMKVTKQYFIQEPCHYPHSRQLDRKIQRYFLHLHWHQQLQVHP